MKTCNRNEKVEGDDASGQNLSFKDQFLVSSLEIDRSDGSRPKVLLSSFRYSCTRFFLLSLSPYSTRSQLQ